MIKTFDASSPEINATVAASAGTGKTWLLVTRIIRLLLQGTQPENILAITFTRKASAEMQVRLSQRLLELAQCDDADLDQSLAYINVTASSENRLQARHLYENLLRNTHSIKITTFHAFCQDILRKFPLEADIPPGFDLQEQTEEIQKEAINSLFTEATQDPDGLLAQSLETLFDNLGGISNTQTALSEFLTYRSDWWAYVADNPDPVSYATKELQTHLSIDPLSNPIQVLHDETTESIIEFSTLLEKHANPTNNKFIDVIARNTASNTGEISYSTDQFNNILRVFLTGDNQPRVRKISGVLVKKLGEQGAQRLVDLHNEICEKFLYCLDQLNLIQSYNNNIAWYTAGHQVVESYQHIKEEQRLLDFTDLEWKTFQLLSNSQNAHWIQYKLDQRIEHILVDEFQDTNPTQWQLLLPLLHEMSAADPERRRSAFLVGDTKQSIYRFRRAEPRLFSTASDFLQDKLSAESFPLDKSRRSASAIIDFVNLIFENGPLKDNIATYQTHSTAHEKLWGQVEVLPLIEPMSEDPIVHDSLRNPLDEPRLIAKDTRHYREGLLIATRIKTLIHEKTIISLDGLNRHLEYGDIIILVQTRSHAKSYEAALREQSIPYLGINRGTLLESLEVRDVIALLDTLISPVNNLALANTLKSPLFNCSDQDLMQLAHSTKANSWYQRLEQVAAGLQQDHPLFRAYNLLTQWHTLAGKLPAHDLLDRVFSQGNLIARFESAFPPHLRSRVRANLTRFVELALEVDSGRYPSLTHFLARLRHARDNQKDAPDEISIDTNNSSVRIMTIHGSKGLEAPVIFLADAAHTRSEKYAYQTLIDWPPEASKPDYFMLMGKKMSHDPVTKRCLQHQLNAAQRENANLLYVAITRARQILIISGCRPNKKTDLGWYGIIQSQLEQKQRLHADTSIITESGTRLFATISEDIKKTSIEIEIDTRLGEPFNPSSISAHAIPGKKQSYAYESNDVTTNTTDGKSSDAGKQDVEKQGLGKQIGKQRGTLIHRLLELLSTNKTQTEQMVLKYVAHEHFLSVEDSLLQECMAEALAVYNNPSFSYLFDASSFDQAHNEIPIHYLTNGQAIFGIIDRLVFHENEIILLDYKTHREASPETTEKLAEQFRSQMRYYYQGIKKLWPDKTIRPQVLFTTSKSIYEFDFNAPSFRA